MSLARRYYPTLFLIILAFAFYTRVWNLHIPQKYIFDEVYHAATAKLIARNDKQAFEWWNPPPEPNTSVDWLHPPLAKYTQALSINAFGENSFGWRFSSAVFGTGVILMTMLVSLRLFNSKPVSLVVGVLASSDGLLLAMSRIAMNDIHVTFFILLTIYLYTYYRPELTLSSIQNHKSQKVKWAWLFATALSAGLAAGTKWSGAFAVALVLIWEGGFALRDLLAKRIYWKQYLTQYISTLLICLLLPAAVYIGSYSMMFLQGKDLHHFVELHKQIWWYQTNLDATHPHQSEPWQWFLNLRPVWIDVEYISNTSRLDIYAQGNPALFWLGGLAAIGVTVMLTIRLAKLVLSTVKKRKKTNNLLSQIKVAACTIAATMQKEKLLPSIFVLSAYCIVWLPWTLSPRIMFFYHYTPAVPLLSILFGWFLWKLWRGEFFSKLPRAYAHHAVMLQITLCVLLFFLWYPHWVGIPTPIWIKEHVYFAIPSWK